ncbi:hypothetical protein M0805_004863 [Coniferiporia weirii]|nr:hypothetical protein M0805_004863 [Coniferiporia weirii]
MKTLVGSNARALLTFHHILSSKKKRVIWQSSRDLRLAGICKVGYPGVLAVEGSEESVGRYVREIKSLRWASCVLADKTTGISDSDLKMSEQTDATENGLVMVEKMNEVGSFMRRAGLEDWWRRAMGYMKGSQNDSLGK